MERWTGRTAVVTGASNGIGAAVAMRLADAGLRVIGLARRSHLVEELQSQVNGSGQIYAKKCDISKPEEVAKVFECIEKEFGGTDILVNNAGFLMHGHITEYGDYTLTEEEIISTFDTNIKGMIMCARHAVSSMKNRNFNGHIININSVAGHYIPYSPVLNIYTSTKHAVTAFTKSLAQELAHFNSKIKITSISPGLVETDMTNSRIEELKPLIALAAKLQPEDVADVVYYALSTPPHVNINELTMTAVTEKAM